MNRPKVVSEAEWLVARQELLRKEKEFTRERDALSAERRKLPWVKIDKEYVFDGLNGKETLADLFDGRSQLIVYHFMFGPNWKEGLPELFVSVRSHRWHARAPGASRRDVTGDFASATASTRSLQKAHGLAVQMGVVIWQRFQLRLSRFVHREGDRGWQNML
jgi:predicted dithiol-disulfide oxidoreductase (DUF899 family)